jgi:RNA polymerase sigma-70 factor (ECF subfamily)
MTLVSFSAAARGEGVEVVPMDERGQPESFEELALPLLDRLHRYAHWLTRNASEAQDLVQETYLKAIRGFGGFTPGSNMRAWMFRILRNTFLTSRSGLRAVPPVSLDEEREPVEGLAAAATPESELLRRGDAARLRSVIEALPVEFREVLLLSDAEEMSYKEIAEALAIPVGTVASRLVRAREKVREGLGRR